MLRDDALLGVIVMWKMRVEPFTDKQVELVATFADQAVIAIENVRLFNELEARNRDLTEALERQTATSEILRVISQSPTDVQPVFDTIAKASLELCRAESVNVFTFDGKLVHLAAFVNVDPDYVEAMRAFYPRPLGRDTAVLRAIQSRSVVVIPDVLDDSDYVPVIGNRATAGRFRSILAVPLMRERKAIGGIAVGRPEPGPFPASQIALLQTFADQAVIAIENVRLFTELEARTRELTRSVSELKALGEVGQAVSSTLESGDRAGDDRLARDRARGTGRRIDLGVRRRARGIPAARDEPAARRAGRRAPGHAHPQGRGRARAARGHRRAGRDPRHRGRAELPEPAARSPRSLRLSVGAGRAASPRGPAAGRARRQPQRPRRLRAPR